MLFLAGRSAHYHAREEIPNKIKNSTTRKNIPTTLIRLVMISP